MYMYAHGISQSPVMKEMENMEPFYLADAKVEMIDDPKPETA